MVPRIRRRATAGRFTLALCAMAGLLLPVTSAAAATVSPPYSAVPPAGITCRTVDATSVNYRCVIGYSVEGREIIAERQGNASAARVLLVNGQMHGEEWPGPLVVDHVRNLAIAPTASFQIWTIRTINPDGGRIGRRWNSHGVDLNGNFPNKFKVLPRSGPHALSEPESAAMVRFLTWLQPGLIISLHGFATATDTTGGGKRAAWAHRFSALTHITPAHPVSCDGPCHGNMTDWYTATSKVHGVAFTVEMPHTSKLPGPCSVPGHSRRATTIDCTAWAAAYLAAQLPV